MGDELHLIRAAQDSGRRAGWTALPAMDQAPTMSDIPTCFCRRSDAFLTCACGGCTGVRALVYLVPVAVSAHNGILATARPIEGIVIDGDAGDWPATTICARCWDIHGRSCARRIGLKITHPDDLVADVEQFERVLNGDTDGYSINKRFHSKGWTRH